MTLTFQTSLNECSTLLANSNLGWRIIFALLSKNNFKIKGKKIVHCGDYCMYLKQANYWLEMKKLLCYNIIYALENGRQ